MSDKEKLDSLDQRIREMQDAEKKKDALDQEEHKCDTGEQKGAQAGAEFLSTVIAGALLGFLVDWLTGFTPLGTIFFIVIGFISATYRANAQMKGNNEKNDE